MEHIDEKMTRLELYHRVIDGIATALGYRMGQTYDPEALVAQVEKLAAFKPVSKALVSYFNAETSVDDLYQIFCEWRTAISDIDDIYLDDAGYPTDVALSKISNWSSADGWTELLAFVRTLWAYNEYWSEEKNITTIDLPTYKVVADVYHLSTAGWSGNESLIRALKNNSTFWQSCWHQSQRGGHYILHVKTRSDAINYQYTRQTFE